MLVLTRDYEKGNKIVVETPTGEKVEFFLVQTMRRSQARIGINAPEGYKITRDEDQSQGFHNRKSIKQT